MHALFKLTPPRPDFPVTMTDEERLIMGQHVEYWSKLLQDGHVLVFGPVFDPAGVYGIGVVEATSLETAQAWADADPAKHIVRIDVFPMELFKPSREG